MSWRHAVMLAGVAGLVVGCSSPSSTTSDPPTPTIETERSSGSGFTNSDNHAPTTQPVTPSTFETAATSATVAPGATVHGKVVTLDPGHNGGNAAHAKDINRLVDIGNATKACDTAGTQTNDGYPEHEFTWDVADRVRAQLEAHGVKVVVTRADDVGWGPCIDQRAAIGNQAQSDAAVSIHADGGPSTGRGFHIIQPGSIPGLTDAITTPSAALGRALHEAYAATGIPPADYIARDGYDIRTDLGGLNRSTVPKVFIECANMRNATDAALVRSSEGRAQIASAIVAGIVAYLATS
jgi:N-acetylmuramoyl-L-alanine amidase